MLKDLAKPAQAATRCILVVDDDTAILRLVRDKFEHAGYEVITSISGQQALDLVDQRGLPHLAIVDLLMPGMDGFEFCRKLQQHGDLPIIMLTAVDEEETMIKGIELFAEDYVTKPFSPNELLARVQRVLRRVGDFSYALAPVVQVDDRLAIDLSHRHAIVDGAAVPLTPTESKILHILIRNAGHTVTSEFLLRRLWPAEDVFEDALRVHVHRLRHKIEPNPEEPCYLRTVRGIGYTFTALKSRS